MKKTATAAILVLFITGATAVSFGTMPSEKTKTTDSRTANFYIDMINTGNENLEIELQTLETEQGETVRYKIPEEYSSGFQSFILPPSKTTRNPEEDTNWLYRGNGKYTETARIKIRAERSKDIQNMNFRVKVKAQQVTPENNSAENVDPRQDVVQVRTYGFSFGKQPSQSFVDQATGTVGNFAETVRDAFGGAVNTIAPSGGGGGKATAETDTEVGTPNVTVEQQQKEEKQRAPAENQDRGTQQLETPNNNSDNNITGDFTALPGPQTLVMLLIFLASVIYLWRVI
ncbi:MAG: hypothetical protein ABEJ83_03095 [Candidatus Nanohaloarchaea archaeon]